MRLIQRTERSFSYGEVAFHVSDKSCRNKARDPSQPLSRKGSIPFCDAKASDRCVKCFQSHVPTHDQLSHVDTKTVSLRNVYLAPLTLY